MTVAPGTLASAAARTFCSLLPVSGVSSLRCGPNGLFAPAAVDEVDAVVEPDEELELAAAAMP